MDSPQIKRRGFFSFLAVAFAYILYLVAENNRWIIVTHWARSYEPGIKPVCNSSAREISLLLIGDTGNPSEQRADVIQAISKHGLMGQFDAVAMLGDNFYEQGVRSVDDDLFQRDFEQVFRSDQFDCPFYPVLGNHDYAGNIDAQVEYSQRSDRWSMPDLYYKVRHETEDQTLDLFVIDSNIFFSSLPNLKQHLAWLERELAASDANWKVVMGHHPCLSGGEHGPAEKVNDLLSPLFVKYGVDLYVAGHEHDLQMIDSGQGWRQVISGSGSKIRSTSWIDETEFAAATPGFAWLLVQNNKLSVSFFSCDSHLYTHEIAPRRFANPAKRAMQTA